MGPTTYRAGEDLVSIEGGEGIVEALAARLWEEAAGPRDAARPRIRLRTLLERDRPCGDPERDGAWDVGDEELRLEAPGISLRVRPQRDEAEAGVSRDLVEGRPALAARLLLETPVALSKMTRMQLLHAGALVGPRGAVVVRGAAGAGKSTLVGAGWRRGLGVLGDESLLVRRDAPDLLEATLRDLALTPGSARLLGLAGSTEPAFSGGEEKRRIPLFASARPSDRTARRLATLLLGPRAPGPARLLPLAPARFRELFGAGEIPQERSFGADPEPVAAAWAQEGAFLLEGTVDLAGAVEIVTGITGTPGEPDFPYTPSQQSR